MMFNKAQSWTWALTSAGEVSITLRRNKSPALHSKPCIKSKVLLSSEQIRQGQGHEQQLWTTTAGESHGGRWDFLVCRLITNQEQTCSQVVVRWHSRLRMAQLVGRSGIAGGRQLLHTGAGQEKCEEGWWGGPHTNTHNALQQKCVSVV